MDICTFETAKKLKAAGFTEPKHTFGQFWYSRTCEPWVIGRLAPNAECVAISITDTRWDHIWDTVGFVFAPTATDILNELEGFFLSPMVGGGWGVFKVGTRAMLGFHSENPAEACAEAYLSLVS